jgi:hypothetical protein
VCRATAELTLYIDGATHESLIGDKKDAAAATQAILDVVSSVSGGRPLGR